MRPRTTTRRLSIFGCFSCFDPFWFWFGFRVKPPMQTARDRWHDEPSHECDHARVENHTAENEIPRFDYRAKNQVQDHRRRENSEKCRNRHLPTRWRTARRAKPRFEPMQLPIYRLAFRQRPCPLLPRFEHRRFVEGIALFRAGECAEDANLARV